MMHVVNSLKKTYLYVFENYSRFLKKYFNLYTMKYDDYYNYIYPGDARFIDRV